MKYIKKHQKILLISMVLVIITSMFLVLHNSHAYKELPQVKLKNNNELKEFALMVEQDNGEYLESDGAFPTEGYAFNEQKSGCTDINGKIIDGALNYDYENYTIILNTDKTSYCYLYYDIEPNISYLRSKDNNSQLTKELTGGLYRYQGSFPDSDSSSMPNWILFGTKEECNKDEEDKCTNSKLNNMTYADYVDKYMYRIIGINAKGELYLLKETFLKEESVGAGSVNKFVWNDEYKISVSDIDLCPGDSCPEWNESDLFKRINGTANGTTPGNGNANDGKDDDTDIFVDSSYYDYLKSGDEVNGGESSEWYNLIVNHDWYYGDTVEIRSNILFNGDELYAIETGKSVTTHVVKNTQGTVESQRYFWTNKVNAKISLMYLHDINYAYAEETPGSATNVVNSWIHFQKDGYNSSSPSYEWLSTRWGIRSLGNPGNTLVYARNVAYSGNLDSDRYLTSINGVRPVFYLTNNINLSGNGTKENPFVIGM